MGVLSAARPRHDPTTHAVMADLMWGGVPFTIPSVTAMKYISGAVQVKRECSLSIGGHYNARQTMEREMIGHKMSRREMVDSYEYYDRLTRRARSHVRQTPGFTAGREQVMMVSE